MLVCDLVVGTVRRPLDARAQTRWIRVSVVVFAAVAWLGLLWADQLPVVDLLLLAYAVVVQFFPVVVLGLYWSGATRAGAEAGLTVGLVVAALLIWLGAAFPDVYASLNPAGIEPGLLAVAFNALVLVCVSVWTPRSSDEHLERFELPATAR